MTDIILGIAVVSLLWALIGIGIGMGLDITPARGQGPTWRMTLFMTVAGGPIFLFGMILAHFKHNIQNWVQK